MTDNRVIDEAVALVRDGYSVTLPVQGRSMLPFIIGGRESVVLAPPSGLRRGLIALAWVEDRRYVLHRIERIEGDRVTLMGDGNIAGREYCKLTDIRAVATHVMNSAHSLHNLYSPWRKAASALWWMLLPVRRYLLAIYWLFNKNKI